MQNQTATRSWDNERLYTFRELAECKNLPVEKSRWSLRQWARRGVPIKPYSKTKVKLPTVFIGNVRYTSMEALREFLSMFTERVPE